MAKYKVGDCVQTKDTNLKAVILKVYDKRPGRQLYSIFVSDEGTKKDVLEANILPVVDLDDPFDCCANGRYGSNSDFFCLNTSFKIRNTNNNTISTLKASKTIFKAYQFKPLLKFLNSRNHRILIADEVGLGKTIEAGHIMLEIAARKELRNALIVCPKSLQQKWKDELSDKFGFNFKIYENAKDLIQDFNYLDDNIRAIVNYEKIRLGNPLLQALQESNKHFDFVLCDEAHRLRNSETLIHRGLREILEGPASAVFLTATPVMISQENLFNLLSLLDEEQYGNYDVFLNTLAINAPFVKAITQLNNGVDYETIARDLSECQVSTCYSINSDVDDYVVNHIDTYTIEQKFKDSALYQRIMRCLLSGDRSHETQVMLQFDLSAMSPMNNIFSRTRKREVTTDWTQAIRDTCTRIVDLYPEEQEYFDNVNNQYLDDDPGESLRIISQKRQISSSVFAYENGEDNLNEGIDIFEGCKDAKFEELLNIIDVIKHNGEKYLIVFAIFKNTLKYLSLRLNKLGIENYILTGELDFHERYETIVKFQESESFTILLSSEVGGEGLDMQFCNSMVNYDLPWNPMIVEQRIGRIDRFGQKSPRVHIYNLLIKDSIQVDIYSRLLDRIDIFKSCIGDLEAILDQDLQENGVRNIQEWFSRLEKEMYCNNISIEDRQRKLDAIAKAILTERKNLEEINQGLTNTLTNDLYFKNEIDSINKNNRYVTDIDTLNYVKLLINNALPTIVMSSDPHIEEAYVLRIPKSEPKLLINFLNEYLPVSLGRDYVRLNKEFCMKIMEETEIPITFSQDIAYEHKELNFINAYHPLITSAYLYFKKNANSLGHAFSFSLSKEVFPDWKGSLSKQYFMALYVIAAEKSAYGESQKIEIMKPIIYDVDNCGIVDDSSFADMMYSAAQESASLQHLVSEKINEDLILSLRLDMEDAILKSRDLFVEEESMRIEAQKDIQIKQYIEFYDAKIESAQNILKRNEDKANNIWASDADRNNSRRILPALRKNVVKLEEEKESVIDKIKSSKISVKEHRLISLSYINLN